MIALLAGLGSRVKAWLALAGAAVLFIAAAYTAGRRDAARGAATDALDGLEAGRRAVAEGRDAGTPDERLRRNDGDWQ